MARQQSRWDGSASRDPTGTAGVPQVQVSFDIDCNGLLQVSATDRNHRPSAERLIQGGIPTSVRKRDQPLALEEAHPQGGGGSPQALEWDRIQT